MLLATIMAVYETVSLYRLAQYRQPVPDPLLAELDRNAQQAMTEFDLALSRSRLQLQLVRS